MFDEDYIVTGWSRALSNEMSGYEFETFCAELLSAAGFWRADTTPRTNDGGIDILASNKDVSYAIQCKRQDQPVGPGVIRAAAGSRDFYESQGVKCSFAVVMTNSVFSEQAKAAAKSLNVLLWDRGWIESMADEKGLLLL